jgi:hypothetical protein
MIRRLLQTATLAGALALVLAGSAAAGGGGGGGFIPGVYHFTDSSAEADLQESNGNVSFVAVDRGTLFFRLRNTTGGPVVQKSGTVVQIGTPVGYGCWIVPDSDFVISPDLHSASLHTTVPAQSNCPGFFLVAGAAAATGVVPDGGDGGGGGLTSPTTIDVAWTWKGSIAQSESSFGTVCGGSTFQSHGTSRSASSTALATISALSGPAASASARISSGSSNLNVTGIPPDSCF